MLRKFEETGYQAAEFEVAKKVAVQQAITTVPDVYCALVELITNCDDSYSELEKQGTCPSGVIEISVAREKATGRCLMVAVRDEAEGMHFAKLQAAMKYGETSAKAQSERTSRGLFNRGLKEAILAMGSGTVYSSDSHEVCSRTLTVDSSGEPDQKEHAPIPAQEFDFNSSLFTGAKRGTVATIKVQSKDFIIPAQATFAENLRRHYALRHILSSEKRKVCLYFEDVTKGIEVLRPSFTESTKCLKHTLGLRDLESKGVLRVKKNCTFDGYDYRIVIYQATEPFEVKNEDWDLAGLVIYTNSHEKKYAIDFQRFGYDSEPLIGYFYGEITCTAIDKLAREALVGRGQAVMNPNRSGLFWKKHPLLRNIWDNSRGELQSLIAEVRNVGKDARPAVVSRDRQRKFFDEVNKLAKKYLQGPVPGVNPTPPIGPGGSSHLPLAFDVKSLYLPLGQTAEITAKLEKGSLAAAKHIDFEIRDENPLGALSVSKSRVPLTAMSKYKLSATTKVTGIIDGGKATIRAVYGVHHCDVAVRVKEKPEATVLFNGYNFDTELKPKSRAYRSESGCIWISVNHPAVGHFASGKQPFGSKEGRVVLAELICEAVCHHVAREKLDREGAVSPDPDQFLQRVFSFQKDVLPIIQQNIELLIHAARSKKKAVEA